jgi:hypothetical protein
MLGEVIDAARGDRSSINETLSLRIHRLSTTEVLRQVVEDGGQAIVFVQSW